MIEDDNYTCSPKESVKDEQEKDDEINVKINKNVISVNVKSTSANRNKTVECRICLRKMRSDTLKRHMQTHRDIRHLEADEVRTEIKKRKKLHDIDKERKQSVKNIAKEEGYRYYDYVSDVEDEELLEESMLCDDKYHLDTIELGRRVNKIIDKGIVHEESLQKYRKDALKLYRKQKPTRDLTQVELRAWQQELQTIIETPTEREIIWVQGTKGNEGKTWYQDYLAALHGYARVVRLDLKLNTQNVMYILNKRPLCTTDIFLFNERRALNNETCNYTILESIKDGIAVSTKYNSDILQFKVPNVVIVFSNHIPSTKQLSKDRWKIFRILKDGLKDITEVVWRLQHDKK